MKEKLKDIFESRGLEMRDYSARNILEYVTPKKPHVSAMGTSGGKTLMTAARNELYYSSGILKKNDITLILPSDKTILRGNFVKQFQSFFKDIPASFTWLAVKNRKELKEAVDNKIQVIIVLPQLLNDKNIELLKGCKIKWMVLDEAHKWYFASTIQRIIDKLNPKYQSLLTGTPFKFNEKRNEFLIDYTSVKTMYEKGLLSDVDFQVLHSSVELTKLDYTSLLNSLKSNKRIDARKYRQLFREVLTQLIKKLKLPNKSMTTFNNISKNALSVFGNLEKTIIFTHGIPEAQCLDKYLKELGVNVLTSHSKTTDEIPEETFLEFENNPKIEVLIAVNRGKEGFDFPDLHNVIDMTFTQNFSIVMQIAGRLMRKSKGHTKTFFKVAPKNTAGYFVDWMDYMFMLFDDYWYQNFTGKNAYSIRVPNALLARNKQTNQTTVKSSKKGKGNFKPKNLEELIPNSLSFMKKNAWFKLDDPLSTVATTSLAEIVKQLYLGNNQYNPKWDEDSLTKEALKYNNRSDFKKYAGGALDAAKRLGIYEEVCSHMPQNNFGKRPNWTDEEARNIFNELKENCKTKKHARASEYWYSLKSKFSKEFDVWYNSLTSLKERKAHTKNEISKLAKKYPTRKLMEKNGYGRCVAIAVRDGYADAIFKNELKIWNREKVLSEIKKYKHKQEIRQKQPNLRALAITYDVWDSIPNKSDLEGRQLKRGLVLQKNDDNKIINKFKFSEALKKFGSGITRALYGKKEKKHKGFYWEYEK